MRSYRSNAVILIVTMKAHTQSAFNTSCSDTFFFLFFFASRHRSIVKSGRKWNTKNGTASTAFAAARRRRLFFFHFDILISFSIFVYARVQTYSMQQRNRFLFFFRCKIYIKWSVILKVSVSFPYLLLAQHCCLFIVDAIVKAAMKTMRRWHRRRLENSMRLNEVNGRLVLKYTIECASHCNHRSSIQHLLCFWHSIAFERIDRFFFSSRVKNQVFWQWTNAATKIKKITCDKLKERKWYTRTCVQEDNWWRVNEMREKESEIESEARAITSGTHILIVYKRLKTMTTKTWSVWMRVYDAAYAIDQRLNMVSNWTRLHRI